MAKQELSEAGVERGGGEAVGGDRVVALRDAALAYARQPEESIDGYDTLGVKQNDALRATGARPMTTDSEAWWQAFLVAYRECIRLAGSLASNGTTEAAAANGADHALGQYRERQKRGDFGAQSEEALDAANRTVADMAREIDRLERERDEAREALLKAERLHAERRQEVREQRTRAEAAEKATRTAEARADASFREKVAVVSLLKEALGALGMTQFRPDLRGHTPQTPILRICACGRHQPEHTDDCAIARVLSKAKTQGYLPDGEVTT